MRDEHVYLDARRHGIVLVRPLARAVAFGGLGVVGLVVGGVASYAGAVLLVGAGIVALVSVWRWDRAHVVLTAEELRLLQGVLWRRAAAVRLAKVRTVTVEQSLLGRVLGYGTVVAGELEIAHVPKPRELSRLVQALAAAA